MKVELSYQSRHIIIIILILLACALLYIKFFSTNHFSCTIDKRLAPTIKQNIIDYLHNNASLQSASLYTIQRTLQKQFPFIKTITAELFAPYNAHITIESIAPLLVINTSDVLTDTDTIINKKLFDEEVTNKLAHITLAPSNTDKINPDPTFIALCKQIPKKIHDQYNITWHSPRYTQLTHAHKENFSIICDSESLTNITLIEKCADLEPHLHPQNPKQKGIFADIRFNNQIIISHTNQEVTHA